jgi:hypothetical protein
VSLRKKLIAAAAGIGAALVIIAMGSPAAMAAASNPAAPDQSGAYVYSSYAGAHGEMWAGTVDGGVTAGDKVWVNTTYSLLWEQVGCDADGYCKQQVSSTDLCLSTYGVTLNNELVLEDCGATGNGRQYDMLWHFTDDILQNYGASINSGQIEIAVSNGNNGDHVNLGIYVGAKNNNWSRITPH